MQSTVVVVPCYNEAKRLRPDSFTDAARGDPSLSFIFVDDGSGDGTLALLEQLRQRAVDQIQVLQLGANQGKAEAVRRGVQLALEQSAGLVAYFDADLATPLDELDGMRRLFSTHPSLVLALGSRVALLGREVLRSPLRHYLGRAFASTASMSLGLTVYDTQCGAKVFRNTPAVRSVFAQPFTTRWIFDVEILARLNALVREGLLPPLGTSAAEYPLQHWRDVSGSKLSRSAALRAGLELAQLTIRYRQGWRR